MSVKRVNRPPKLPPRPREGHKGLFGRVLVVGGSEEMIGAPVLSGTAALRIGAGLVQIAMPKAVLATALSITPELIGLGLVGDGERSLVEAAEKADAIAVGPGMGRSREASSRLKVLIRLDKPMVIDADGLNLLSDMKTWPRQFNARAVLTPHPGEMKRLARFLDHDDVPGDDEGRITLATLAARTFGQVVVLKGDRTVVADASRVFVNDTGNSALSKAGSGDVLTGMLAALLGQGMDRFEASCLAVHLHGLAGEIAGERFGLRSPLARDVIDALPDAILRYEAATTTSNATAKHTKGREGNAKSRGEGDGDDIPMTANPIP